MNIEKSHYYSLASGLLIIVLAVFVLGGLFDRGKSTEELIGDLSSSRETDRLVAVRKLNVNSEEAEKIVPALVKSLKDSKPDIRAGAAIKLGVYGERAKEALPALQEALHDKDPRVREAAKNAIARIDPNAPLNEKTNK